MLPVISMTMRKALKNVSSYLYNDNHERPGTNGYHNYFIGFLALHLMTKSHELTILQPRKESYMIETTYEYAVGDEKHIEKIIDDDPVMINHMVLPKGECVPDHHANSYVHMLVIRGILTLQLGDQEPHHYPRGTIVNIPFDTFMRVRNEHEETVEFFVVKSPSPRLYGKHKVE